MMPLTVAATLLGMSELALRVTAPSMRRGRTRAKTARVKFF